MEITPVTVYCLRMLQVVLGASLIVSCHSAAAQKRAPVKPDQETYGYLSGQFELIGRFPDSTKTFRGTVRLTFDGTRLRVERTVDGKTVIGSAKLDVSGPDRLEVLRASFPISGKDYEATYLWRSDLDNYPILTGRVFTRGTKSPGVEVWFPQTGP